MVFHDREDAGRQLAVRLTVFGGDPKLVVLGIPRGGVVVAYEVARALEAPLDVFLAAKLRVPGKQELAFGAMAESGECFLDQDIVRAAHVGPLQIAQISDATRLRLHEKAAMYRAERPAPALRGKTVILVDDGIATGASIHVSILALRSMEPARLAVAVPVAPAMSCALLRHMVDELVCVYEPKDFEAVSQFYLQFPQSTDAEVAELLRRAVENAP